jgi:hypothetical protein
VGTVQSAALLQDRCEWVMLFDEGNGFVSLEKGKAFSGFFGPFYRHLPPREVVVPSLVTDVMYSVHRFQGHRCSGVSRNSGPVQLGWCLLLCTVYVRHLDFWKCKGGSRWMVEELYVLSRFSSGNIWSISVWCSL